LPFLTLLDPVITISTNHVSATAGTAITPVTITNAGLISYYSISPAISNGLSFKIARSLVSLFFMFKKYTVTFKKKLSRSLMYPQKKSKNRATLADKSH
jgi:hypothetical protein